MTLTAITALINVLTLAVLSASVIVALIQLGHVRAGNQLQSMLELERRFTDPQLQRALLYVERELANKLTRPAYRAGLAGRGYIDLETHPEMAVCNWFDEMGTLVDGGFMSESVFMDSFGRLVEHFWHLLSPAIAVMRRERGPEQYASFAVLAQRAQRWREHGHAAQYRGGARRMPLTDPWAERDLRERH